MFVCVSKSCSILLPQTVLKRGSMLCLCLFCPNSDPHLTSERAMLIGVKGRLCDGQSEESQQRGTEVGFFRDERSKWSSVGQ